MKTACTFTVIMLHLTVENNLSTMLLTPEKSKKYARLLCNAIRIEKSLRSVNDNILAGHW
jgi:hypothetical protein